MQYELSQLGNTGIIVLETCAPKLAKAKKKVNIGTAPSPFKILLRKWKNYCMHFVLLRVAHVRTSWTRLMLILGLFYKLQKL